MASDFLHLLNSQDRTDPVPVTHTTLVLDRFAIQSNTDTPLKDLQDEWNKIANLERISWIEDQGYEYEIFLKNTLDTTNEAYIIKMILMLPKEAASAYLMRWS
jgi:hypothetical protein